MPTRDQERAALAFEHVSAFAVDDKEAKTEDGKKRKAKAKKYGTMIHKLPALLQTAGLCQTMHFVLSRIEKKDGKEKKDDEHRFLLEHFAAQLKRVNGSISNSKDLLERARKAELEEYLQLTDEAMACAAWYRRLVQGVLKIDASDDSSDKEQA